MEDLPDTSPQEENEAPRQYCLNCRTVLSGRFCSHCGQDSRPFRRSFGSVMKGAAEGFFDLDGKVLKSIWPLLFSPGKLTVDFLDGRRKMQVNPFQLYAFFSFLFFFTRLYVPAIFQGQDYPDGKPDASVLALDSLQNDSVQFYLFDVKITSGSEKKAESVARELASYDSLQLHLAEDQRDGFLDNFAKRRFYHLKLRLAKEGKTVLNELLENFKSNIPNTLILLIPVFAFLLKLLYFRREFYFLDHLIFSIHLFCFIFLIGTLLEISEPLRPDNALVWICIGIGCYFALAMKRVYCQTWRKTVLKLFLVSFLYSIFCVIALSLSFLYAMMIQT
jgi:hypothetical protein